MIASIIVVVDLGWFFSANTCLQELDRGNKFAPIFGITILLEYALMKFILLFTPLLSLPGIS